MKFQEWKQELIGKLKGKHRLNNRDIFYLIKGEGRTREYWEDGKSPQDWLDDVYLRGQQK